ncbi:hypothetical protein HELRODRAFT_161729 [Helobdella robusta]|uniref:Uncharacterized protein n=1 Tax=Helobdella robusta TaxID=6412 RepID=T1ERU5_HELRO|nr:hypothetical protein HELRODRAFT_161729 [Helobdella robusta]ESO02458.1 hypothetical protein HELRODRAFT_161729 [Helobdella robusta]
MASKTVVINEMLYFLTNNFDIIDNEAFVFNISEFYSQEEVGSGLKCLKNELELYKIEITIKLISHGTNKKDKVADCIDILECLKTNNLYEKCPVFVSKDLERVPKLENIIKINFENLRNEISGMLAKQQVCLLDTFESCKKQLTQVDSFNKQIFQLNEKLNSLKPNYDKTLISAENTKDSNSLPRALNDANSNKYTNKNVTLGNEVIKTPTNTVKFSWADRANNDVQSDDNLNDDNFTLVQRSKNKIKSRALPSVKIKPEIPSAVQRQQQIQQTKKVIGKKTNCSTTLRSMKTEPRKKLVYVGKLDQCTSEDLINHLKAIDVKAISCIPLTKSIFNKKSSSYNNNNNTNNNSSQTNETKTSAAFRIVFLETDLIK